MKLQKNATSQHSKIKIMFSAPAIGTFFAHIYLMMAIGFGGFSAATSIAAYLVSVFIWLYVILGFSTVAARKSSLVAIAIPWVFLCLAAIAQIEHAGKDLIMFLGAIAILCAIQIPGEFVAGKIGRLKRNDILLPKSQPDSQNIIFERASIEAIYQFRELGKTNKRCPACASVISISRPTSLKGAIKTDCGCGKCNGIY
jgi:hypothetical protein